VNLLNHQTKLRTPALALLLTVSPVLFGADDAELEAVRERVAKEFDIVGPEHVKLSPVDGWFTIQKGTIVAYISNDGRYLLQGDLIDLDAQVNLTELSRDDARREMIATLGDDRVISFAPETVKHRITVFTDVGCAYCRRMHSEIDRYLSAGIEVRYVLYPRNGPESPDWQESEKVWCSSDRNTALTAAKRDQPFQTANCDASIIQANYQLGQDVGLTGTPAIVLEDGTMIGGYMPADMLAAELEKNEPQASRK
jgi:thiol:disulfide interchange protein DsbC